MVTSMDPDFVEKNTNQTLKQYFDIILYVVTITKAICPKEQTCVFEVEVGV